MSQDRLFDISPHSPTLIEALGRKPNDHLASRRWARVTLDEDTQVYTPANAQNSELTSPDYQPTHHENDFVNWAPRTREHPTFEGYLVGFPKIDDVDCLHFWSHESDIFLDSFATSTAAIRSLYIYSRTRTRFEAELDHINMTPSILGNSDVFKVPLLYDSKNDVMLYRPANSEDIQTAIDDQDEPPIVVVGHDPDIKRFLSCAPEKLKTILDE